MRITLDRIRTYFLKLGLLALPCFLCHTPVTNANLGVVDPYSHDHAVCDSCSEAL